HYIIPHFFEEPILPHEASALPNKEGARVEISGIQFDSFSIRRELTICHIQRELAEAVHLRLALDVGFIHVAHEMLRWGSCRSQAQNPFYGPSIGPATRCVVVPVCTDKNLRVLTRSNMMNDIATLQDEIRAMSGDPAGLEDLYRQVQAEGSEAAFREALRQCEEEDPGNVLFHAWAHRLGLELEREVA